jgi:hypothetical protein
LQTAKCKQVGAAASPRMARKSLSLANILLGHSSTHPSSVDVFDQKLDALNADVSGLPVRTSRFHDKITPAPQAATLVWT